MKTRNPPRKTKSKPRGGRPRRPEPAAVPASVLGPEPPPSLGTDPALVDPLRILASIASDDGAPAPARVAACKVLLAVGPGNGKPTMPDMPEDALTRRTLALMKQRGRPN